MLEKARLADTDVDPTRKRRPFRHVRMGTHGPGERARFYHAPLKGPVRRTARQVFEMAA